MSSKVHFEIKRRENVARVVPRGLIVVGFKKLQSEFEFWKNLMFVINVYHVNI